MKSSVVPLSISAALMLSCASTFSRVEKLPVETLVGQPRSEAVDAFDPTHLPPWSIVPFATIAGSGNGFSSFEDVKRDMARKAGKLGADCIWVMGANTATGPTVTSYGSGVAISSQVTFPTMSCWACMYAPVKLGAMYDPTNYEVLDVTPGSAAARAGIRIGDRLLAINDVRLTGDLLASYRAISKAVPGEQATLELVDPNRNTRTVSLIWDENVDAAGNRAPRR